jgi:hypothetical protein
MIQITNLKLFHLSYLYFLLYTDFIFINFTYNYFFNSLISYNDLMFKS